MLLHGGPDGGLELRQESDGTRVVTGRFPYNKTATLSDGGRRGRPRKERFKPKAFAFRVNKPDENIHLLVGHDYDRPLASKLRESLTLTDSEEALTFEARISPIVANTGFGADVLALVSAGLAVGLSPGFRIPPERAVEDAESVEEEPDNGPGSGVNGAIIRTINAALLYELSIVTRPAYDESQIEARCWSYSPKARHRVTAPWRWR